ncbi:unnamed protein product [Nesidiocoris tenuis]|uniref:Uncharacterized protein n=1 Tax=Nesidiocoris tenuis TaxID=355587 RepID=A0A6H5G861_9HEMI|nr:unnamed protein product [Nesidiocoris tenuis]
MITITPMSGAVLNNPGMRMPMAGAGGGGGPRFQQHVGRQNNFFTPFRPTYRQSGAGSVIFDPEFDGKRLRKSAMRKTVDYNAAIIKMLEARVWQRDYRDHRAIEPDAMYIPDLMPPSYYEDNPINAVTTRFVKTATNKMRCPIFCMAWTPEGRRLVTGASSGEFTLWNGLTFNFETILQAHDTPVRTMVWSHNEMWMVTADHAGFVKYWQSNMNNVKMFMAHQEAIRGIRSSVLFWDSSIFRKISTVHFCILSGDSDWKYKHVPMFIPTHSQQSHSVWPTLGNTQGVQFLLPYVPSIWKCCNSPEFKNWNGASKKVYK